MTAKEITEQLERLGSVENFPWHSSELVHRWISDGVGFEAVEPILQFIENHPDVDVGTPGKLVWFSEKFCGHGYEEKLLESISRRPVSHTIWMLNRLTNGEKEPATRQRYVDAMIRVKSHPLMDPDDLEHINGCLDRLGLSETRTNSIHNVATRWIERDSKEFPLIVMNLKIDDLSTADAFLDRVIEHFKTHRSCSPPRTANMTVTIVGDMTAADFCARWASRAAQDPILKQFTSAMVLADVLHIRGSELLDRASLVPHAHEHNG
jgi:hypothetical protein